MGHSVAGFIKGIIGEGIVSGFDGNLIRILAHHLLETAWDRLLDLLFPKLDKRAARVKASGSNCLLLRR